MKLFKVRYFINGNAVTAFVKEEGIGKAVSLLEKDADEHDHFNLISVENLDEKEGILHRDYDE